MALFSLKYTFHPVEPVVTTPTDPVAFVNSISYSLISSFQLHEAPCYHKISCTLSAFRLFWISSLPFSFISSFPFKSIWTADTRFTLIFESRKPPLHFRTHYTSTVHFFPKYELLYSQVPFPVQRKYADPYIIHTVFPFYLFLFFLYFQLGLPPNSQPSPLNIHVRTCISAIFFQPKDQLPVNIYHALLLQYWINVALRFVPIIYKLPLHHEPLHTMLHRLVSHLNPCYFLYTPSAHALFKGSSSSLCMREHLLTLL